MKLMKFLVVALVAGGVFAPVLSQASDVVGKAIMCKHVKPFGGRPYTDQDKAEGKHLLAFVFRSGDVKESGISDNLPREIWVRYGGSKQIATPRYIQWNEDPKTGSSKKYKFSLDRKTLQLTTKRYNDRNEVSKRQAQCEVIDPNKIEVYFQPYLDYGKALDAKAMEDNKI